MPPALLIVDTDERIRRIIPIVDEMVGEGMVTLERVKIIAYRTGEDGRRQADT